MGIEGQDVVEMMSPNTFDVSDEEEKEETDN
jgi:hypothetical protein